MNGETDRKRKILLILAAIVMIGVGVCVGGYQGARYLGMRYFRKAVQNAGKKYEVQEQDLDNIRLTDAEVKKGEVQDQLDELQEQSEELSSAYIFPDSDKKKLKKKSLKKKSREELFIGRNEIYARHGCIFENDGLQRYFETMTWYKGTTKIKDFDESVFNEIEKTNISTIRSVESDLENDEVISKVTLSSEDDATSGQSESASSVNRSTCPTCGGSGQQVVNQQMYYAGMGWRDNFVYITCATCGGTGRVN